MTEFPYNLLPVKLTPYDMKCLLTEAFREGERALYKEDLDRYLKETLEDFWEGHEFP